MVSRGGGGGSLYLHFVRMGVHQKFGWWIKILAPPQPSPRHLNNERSLKHGGQRGFSCLFIDWTRSNPGLVNKSYLFVFTSVSGCRVSENFDISREIIFPNICKCRESAYFKIFRCLSSVFLLQSKKGGKIRNRCNQVPHLTQDTTQESNKYSKWVWSGNSTITNRRQPHGTARKSHSTITRHQEDHKRAPFQQMTTRQKWTDTKTWQTQNINNTNDVPP